MVVSDLVHRAVHVLMDIFPKPPRPLGDSGHLLAPQGLAVDATSCFLVTDYRPGAVHSFTSVPTLELLASASMLRLEGPCWVGLGPDGGFAVSEEFGVVRKFLPPLGFPGGLPGPAFGSPACVCTDSEGNVIVTDKQQCQLPLLPWAAAPTCLVLKGLGRPLGMACAPQGQLMVADARGSYIKRYR
ncbi:LOW QUALITY PROTEIN: NHL-repeat-containing protein 4 [Phyllostomus discolor]|uniref:LOW QUALITY PROTEIN: NHL-repeat-containing protein 4 n=1 Tax=Phyllostomus discolor TaxID=89673 RepID=A0A7E6D9H6_9CHIR|nr:LOW QUALITY PROTEIN: NHL-repeat-containing protein 4 [Phyllostomus discolor]